MRKSKRLLALAMGMTLAVGMTACGSKEAAPRTTAAAAQDSQAKDSQEDKSKDSAPAGKDAAPAASETTYNWKWGTVDSTSNPNYEAMEYFCTLLDEKAPGKWSIQIYPDSQLGDASQLCESVQMGTLEMACPASSIVANYVPDYGVFDMPYLFTTAEEVDAVLDGEVGAELAALADNANMKPVSYTHLLTESPTDGSMISYANFPNMLTGYLDPAASIGMDRTNFEFLALYTSDDNIIMAKKDETRFKDAKEFFEYAKNNIVTIGTAGARTDDAVAVAMLEKELGFEFQHVHYQNSAEGFAAVMGGHIDVLMGNVSEAVNKGEEIMPVVVLSQERSEYLPDVQCTYENDIKVAASSSRGVIAAKGLDPAAKEALLKALKATMEDPDQLAEAKKQGIAVTPIYGDDFEQWMEQQEESIKGIFDLLDE